MAERVAEKSLATRDFAASKPPNQDNQQWDAEYKTFHWAAICQDGSAYAQQQRIERTLKTTNTRQGSDNESASGGRDGASPITVHPEGEDPQAKHDQQSPQVAPTAAATNPATSRESQRT